MALLLVLAGALASPAPASGADQARSTATRAAKPPRCPDRRVETTVNRTIRVSLRCRGLGAVPIQWVVRPRHGRVGAVDQRRKRVRYRPDRGYVGRDRLVVARKKGRHKWITIVQIRVTRPESEEPPETEPIAPPSEPPVSPPPSTPPAPASPPAAPAPPGPGVPSRWPRCTSGDAIARYQQAVTVSITCIGTHLGPLRLVDEPSSGTLASVEESGTANRRTLTATYTPDQLFVGQDELLVRVVSPSGRAFTRADLTVLPWRMRAIGDSVTAGFGYFGDGRLMPFDDLLDCFPPAVVNNRCSSNSDAGPGYTGPPTWSPDFGLANNVSWPAQFANGLQGGGHVTAPQMFQNRAVSGSAPSDWLPGGILNPQLRAIVAEDPELVVMTLGANPLLTDLLLTFEGEACSFTVDVAKLRECIQPFFDEVDLRGRLQQVYTALLQAPHTNVVVFQYHLTIPALNLFATWQLEAMINLFNENIAEAVASTRADLPASQAARLYLIEAQVNPAAPEPTELPRFDTGLPPSIHDSWTGVYNCGGPFEADGPSHQSLVTQVLFAAQGDDFCSGTPWIIDADSGIHPNRTGYAQFATALANVAQANDLIPPLP